MEMRFWLVLITALIPLLTGFIWYHPSVFGKKWMLLNNFSQDDLKKGKMGIIFGLTYVLGIFLSFGMVTIVVHQFSVYGILANNPEVNQPGTELHTWIGEFMAKYGRNFRTFKHGAFHGILASIMIALPIIGINALFERKKAAYIFIHTGYWMLTMALIGGVICQFL